MGKILTFILFGVGVFAIFFILENYSPIKISSLLSGGAGTPFAESSCTRIMTVPDNSMEPIFKEGGVALFNKCVEGKTDDIKPGTIVLVEPLFVPAKIRVIRKKEELAGKINYKVSSTKTPASYEDAPSSDIKGIYDKK